MFLGIGQNLGRIGQQGLMRQALSAVSAFVVTRQARTLRWGGADTTNTAFTATGDGTTLTWSNA